MTARETAPNTRRFVTGILPWIIGAGAFLVYLITLNPWVSLLNLGTILQVSGWSWQPQLNQPLNAILLFPFRFLPDSWIPSAVNVFTATCAALVLVQLARTVVLLPHDLSPVDPLRKSRPATILTAPTAWIPPVLAAMCCGLQLSFWEHATSASGEMIDLLVFAGVIRCLLEYRTSQEQAWLSRSAFLFGAGMANNWAMLALFPVFVAATIRAKGLAFLKGGFLWRMALRGFAGLSLYGLLPLLHSLQPASHIVFWRAMKDCLKSQLGALALFRQLSFVVLIVVSLLSVLLLCIRWESHLTSSGSDTRFGIFLTRLTAHGVHGLFLAGSLWIAFDPNFSPRRVGYGTPMLTSYYISSLTAGYCAGYFLLISSGKVWRRWGPVAVGALYGLVCVMAPLLWWRNHGQIRITNGPALREFARQLYADLPVGRSVVLSDDPMPLYLLRAELSAHGAEKEALPVETRALFSVRYQDYMAGQFKSRWPASGSTNREESVSRIGPLNQVSTLAAREPVFYLHPSSGLFLELFSDEPNGLVHRLSARAAGAITNATPAALVVANEQLWQERWTKGLRQLVALTNLAPHDAFQRAHPVLNGLRLRTEQNSTVATLGVAYSKSMSDWGVRLQQDGLWPEAGVWFRRALELNPGNLSAHINLEYNERCQHGDRGRLSVETMRRAAPDLFDSYRNWPDVLELGGPVDEPTFLLQTGRVFLEAGFVRQAERTFARCLELAPDWIAPQLWLADCAIARGDFAAALQATDRIPPLSQSHNGAALSQLLYCRAKALRESGRADEANRCIESFVEQYGNHREVLFTAAMLYAVSGQLEPQLAVLNRQLNREPKNEELLARKGLVELQLKRNDAAIVTLTAALTLAPADSDARLHRAVACLGAGRLEEARRDYEELLRTSGDIQRVRFGLGAIAWRTLDTNSAIQYYQEYLSNGIPDSTQYTIAEERLKYFKPPASP